MLNVRLYFKFIPLWLMSSVHGLLLFINNFPGFLEYEHYGVTLRNEVFNYIYLMLVLLALCQIEKMFNHVYIQTRFKNQNVLFFNKEKMKLGVLLIFVLIHQLPFIIYNIIYKINITVEIQHFCSCLMFLYILSIIFEKLKDIKGKQIKMFVFLVLYASIFQYSSFCLEGVLYTAYFESEMTCLYTTISLIIIITYYVSQFITYWPYKKYALMPILLFSIVYWMIKTRIYYIESLSISEYIDVSLFTISIDDKILMILFVTFIAIMVMIYLKSMMIYDLFEENKLYFMLRFKNQKQFTYTKYLNTYVLALIILGIHLLPLYILAVLHTGEYLPILTSLLVKKVILYYLGIILMINLNGYIKSRVFIVVGSIIVVYLSQVLKINFSLNILMVIFVLLNIILFVKVGEKNDNTNCKLCKGN